MHDLFKAMVQAGPYHHDDLTTPTIAIIILAAFVIVTTVAAIMYAERGRGHVRSRDHMRMTAIDYEDVVCDILAFEMGVPAETITEEEWTRIYRHWKAGDITPLQSAAMIKNARRRPKPQNDN